MMSADFRALNPVIRAGRRNDLNVHHNHIGLIADDRNGVECKDNGYVK